MELGSAFRDQLMEMIAEQEQQAEEQERLNQAQAKKEKAEKERAEKQRLERERSAKIARKPVPTAPQAKLAAAAKPPTKAAGSTLQVPQHRQPHRKRSHSGLGAALMKGAIGVMAGVAKAELRQMANSSGGGGGGYVNNGGFVDPNSGGGSIDMSSFWAPINDAASSPIQ